MQDDARRFAAYVRAVRRGRHLFLSGRGASPDTARLLRRYRGLGSAGRIERDAVLAERKDAEGNRARLRLTERAGLAIELELAEAAERLQREAAGREVVVEGVRMPLGEVSAALRSCPDRDRRRRLAAARRRALQAMLPGFLELWSARGAFARRLGASGYVGLYAGLKGFDAAAVGDAARRILEGTEAAYLAGLSRWGPVALGVPARAISDCDRPALLRGDPWRVHFDPRRQRRTLAALLERMPPGGRAGIRLDLAERPGKCPRPYTAAVSVPGRIHLVARPAGGPRDLEELLHEAGHAIAFASIPASLPWEERLLSWDSVAETFAFLIGGLVRSERFLAAELGLDPAIASEYAAYAGFVELFMIRRYSAKVLFELSFLEAPEEAAAGFPSLMAGAVGFAQPLPEAVAEMDEALASVDYLVAWMLEAQLRHALTAAAGPDWFRDRDAVEALRSLWAAGGALDAGALARRTGTPAPSPERLVADFGGRAPGRAGVTRPAPAPAPGPCASGLPGGRR